jgi:hypothetical protein
MALDNVVDFLFASANKAIQPPHLQWGLKSAADVFQNVPGNARASTLTMPVYRGKNFLVKGHCAQCAALQIKQTGFML